MHRKVGLLVLVCALLGVFALPALAQDEFVFGVVLVGPENDRGWSQAHYEGGRYVEETVPGTRMIFFPSLNPADAPETTLLDVVDEMVDQGARVIFTASDAFEEDTNRVAEAFPDVVFINISGDDALTGSAPPNVGNLMGQMEWGKLIAGCAAGLTTQTASIGYLGPLINGGNAPSSGVGISGRALLLREVRRRQPRRADLHRHLDRLLVQHPRRDARPERGNQFVLQQRRRCGDLRDRYD
jgi:basic membrane lipoprotein Med (substrate-binding protein (PBP1-ABC) superfamily)